MAEENKETKMSIEEAMEALENIVRQLEQEELPLEESLQYFQEGLRLARFCRDQLTQAEYRVERLRREYKMESGEQYDSETLAEREQE